MGSKLLGTIMTIIGLLLALGGLALILIITPSLRVLPADQTASQTFAVEAERLLDFDSDTLAALSTGSDDVGSLRLQRDVSVQDATEGSALIRETRRLTNGDQTLREHVYHYAVDRTTLRPAEDFPPEWAESQGYWAREGLSVRWPFSVQRRDYDAWHDTYREQFELDFEDSLSRAGVQTISFEAESDLEPMADEQVAWLDLKGAVSADTFNDLLTRAATEADVELSEMARQRLVETVQNALQVILGIEDEVVPLVYYYGFEGTYWVEPTTGMLIDLEQESQRAVTLSASVTDRVEETLASSDVAEDAPDYLPEDILDDLLPVTVEHLTYRMTEDSSSEAVKTATARRDEITRLGRTLPIILVIAGIAVAGAGGFLYARAKQH